MSRYEFQQIKESTARRIASLGGRPLNLYKILANSPDMLDAWVEFAYTLRLSAKTSRTLRELMILRTAQLHDSNYEWYQHRLMAKEAGISESQVADLSMWRRSDQFSAHEKAAIAITEAIVADTFDEELHDEVKNLFSPSELIELLLTASFYCMVPRLLRAMDVPIET